MTEAWRAAVEKIADLRLFLLGYQRSQTCVRNEMERKVGEWIDGLTELFRLYDAHAALAARDAAPRVEGQATRGSADPYGY